MNQRNQYGATQRGRGFSTLEVLLVMVVSLIIAIFALPGFEQVKRTLRIQGDARDLNGAINQAKMMAAANFTEARVYLDLTPLSPGNPLAKYHVDIWYKAGNGGNGCWQTIGDMDPGPPAVPRCILPGVSPVQTLSPGVSFGFAGAGAPPPNTQGNGIAQAQRCSPVNGKRVGQQATSACIQFNSRGIPIDINTGAPTGNGAFYITDFGQANNGTTVGSQVYGVTVGSTGLSQVWGISARGTGNWFHK